MELNKCYNRLIQNRPCIDKNSLFLSLSFSLSFFNSHWAHYETDASEKKKKKKKKHEGSKAKTKQRWSELPYHHITMSHPVHSYVSCTWFCSELTLTFRRNSTFFFFFFVIQYIKVEENEPLLVTEEILLLKRDWMPLLHVACFNHRQVPRGSSEVGRVPLLPLDCACSCAIAAEASEALRRLNFLSPCTDILVSSATNDWPQKALLRESYQVSLNADKEVGGGRALT